MGQSKKKRACPAVAREISSGECGENRVSRYACPAECPFNPFALANYDAVLAIEDKLDALTMQALRDDPVSGRMYSSEFRRQTTAHGQHATTVKHLMYERDASGRTFADRLLAVQGGKLGNDERVLLQGKLQLRVALLEIRQVIDQQQFEAIDLLADAPVPLRFIDQSLVSTAARFDTILTWIYPMPHFWRVSGTGISFNEVVPLPGREIFDECVAHLGGPAETGPRTRWLVDNFVRVDEVLRATAHERRRRMFAAMDATFGSATYDLLGSFSECHEALLSEPLVARDNLTKDYKEGGFTAALVWFAPGPQSTDIPGRRVLGRVLMSPTAIRVEAMGGAPLDDLRRRLEERLGKRVRFNRERRDNLAAQMMAKEPVPDLSLVPPRFLENTSQFDVASSRMPAPDVSSDAGDVQSRGELWKRGLDEQVPALGGRTPREAARDPSARAVLIEWAKGLVRHADRTNLMLGREDDINRVIRELGLTELDIPAPPRRPIPVGSKIFAEAESDYPDFDDPDEDDDFDETDEDFDETDDEFDETDDDSDEADEEFDGDLLEDEAIDPEEMKRLAERVNDWSAPPLPDRPLSKKEADERLTRAFEAFATPLGAVQELMESGPTVLEDTSYVCREMLESDEFGLVTPYIANAWFALVPGGRLPILRRQVMADAFDSEITKLDNTPPKKILAAMLAGSPQPHILELLLAQILGDSQTGPRDLRLSSDAAVYACLLIKVFIAELDHALRE